MVVKMNDSRLIYGNVKKKVMEDKSKVKLVKYIMGKNTY